MTSPYATSAAILDAAAAGTTVPGYEQIGGLLLDLSMTTPVGAGSALGSSEVAAACAASAPGPLAGVLAFVKPGLIVVSLASFALVLGLTLSPSPPADVGKPDADVDGVSRVVGSSEAPTSTAADGGPDSTALAAAGSPSTPPDPTGETGGSGAASSPAVPPSTSDEPASTSPGTTPSTSVPSSSVPSSSVPTTSVAPSPARTADHAAAYHGAADHDRAAEHDDAAAEHDHVGTARQQRQRQWQREWQREGQSGQWKRKRQRKRQRKWERERGR